MAGLPIDLAFLADASPLSLAIHHRRLQRGVGLALKIMNLQHVIA
jgi:hypothetical protein